MILWIHVFVDTIGYRVVDSLDDVGKRYDDMKEFPPDSDYEGITITTAWFKKHERDLLLEKLEKVMRYIQGGD